MKTNISFDWRIVSGVLGLLLIGSVVYGQPWQNMGLFKTIVVTGEGIIEKTPDYYQFMPSYQKTAETSESAIKSASESGNAVVSKLKELGVETAKIQTNVSSWPAYGQTTATAYTANYSITATVTNADLARKVGDYLASSGATSTVTPLPGFTNETRLTLELDARTKAIENSRKKAEQTAKAMGSRLGKVTNISDAGMAYPYPMGGVGYPMMDTTGSSKEIAPGSTLTVDPASAPSFQIGTQEVRTSVTVTYRIW